MKKVINGSLCNTDTARRLGGWDNGQNGLYEYGESLYRTKSGKYFINSWGGAGTSCAQSTGTGSWKSGEKIQLLSPEDAREWAEEHLSGEEYIAAFGEPEEMYSVLVAEKTKARLDELARLTGKDIDQLIADAIDQYDPDVLGD